MVATWFAGLARAAKPPLWQALQFVVLITAWSIFAPANDVKTLWQLLHWVLPVGTCFADGLGAPNFAPVWQEMQFVALMAL